MFRIGCFISAAGGYTAMAKTAESVGANTFQYFSRNPRGGAVKAIDPADVASYLEFCGEHDIRFALTHAPYTLNPCSAEQRVRDFTRGAMDDDLHRLELTPGGFYNFHPGSHVGQGMETGIELISGMLNDILWPEMTTTVLLETMAGKGSEVGGHFEELREIIDRVALKDKLGVCLDTCHIRDGGYDIAADTDAVLTEFDRVIGLPRLRAVHLNDSKNPVGSRKDRHEKIGEGTLGLDAIARIINHPALRELPFHLETPNELPGYAEEIKLLRSLRTGD